MGYLRKRTIWDRIFGRRPRFTVPLSEAQKEYNRRMSARLDREAQLDQWSRRLDMQDEGDLHFRTSKQQRNARLAVKITRVVLAIAIVYVLLTAALVIFQ
jgi:hypothetical protein